MVDLVMSEIEVFRELRDRKPLVMLHKHAQDCVDTCLRWEGAAAEEAVDGFVLFAHEQYPIGLGNTPSRPSYLLIVAHDRGWHLVVNHKSKVRLVVSHAECSGSDQHLNFVGEQFFFEVNTVCIGIFEIFVGNTGIVGKGLDALML